MFIHVYSVQDQSANFLFNSALSWKLQSGNLLRLVYSLLNFKINFGVSATKPFRPQTVICNNIKHKDW